MAEQIHHGIEFFSPVVDREVTIPVPAFDGSSPESMVFIVRMFTDVTVDEEDFDEAAYRELLADMGLPAAIIEQAVVRRMAQGEYAKVYSRSSFDFQGDGAGGNAAGKRVRHGDEVTLHAGYGLSTHEPSNIPKGGGTVDLVCRFAITSVYNGEVSDAETMVAWMVEYE